MDIPNIPIGQTQIQLLEKLIPGLSVVGPIVSSFLGINFIRYIYTTLVLGILDLFTSSISISGQENLHDEVLDWLGKKIIDRPGIVGTGASRLTAVQAKTWDHVTRTSKVPAESSIKYEPASQSSVWFFYKWRAGPFFVRRQRIPSADGPGSDDPYQPGPGNSGSREGIVVTCLGWSTAPLKHFLDECSASARKPTVSITCFYKLDERDHYGKPRGVKRPSRPLDTVDLDYETKELLVEDIRSFREPATVRFYARRGIPHRRGYLFHGPPGTGKTSMSLALAGHFKLDLYLLNLSGFRKGDSGLSIIFDSLPPRCIVLLEDIDSAGIKRENIRTDVENTKKRSKRAADNDEDGESRSTVTLSGLLNAIDGVTSQEGRILLMTTNDPETLDDAMIRPGRIDMQVFFGPISQAVAEQIFVRMYTKDPDEDDSSELKPSATPSSPARLTMDPEPIFTGRSGSSTRPSRTVRSLSLWTSLATWSLFVTGTVYALGFFLDDTLTPMKWLALACVVAVFLFFLKKLITSVWYASRERTQSKPTTATVVARLETPLIKGPTSRRVSEVTNSDSRELHQMASIFASKIPADKFTPAEIQGFLIMHMESASAALAGIDDWVAKLLAAKEQGKNIISDKVPRKQKQGTKANQSTTVQRGHASQQPRAGDLSKQSVVYVTGSPTSVLFPSDAKGHKKLTTYFSYIPKGAAASPEEKQKQKTTVNYFNNAEKAFQNLSEEEEKEDPKPRKKVKGKALNRDFVRFKPLGRRLGQGFGDPMICGADGGLFPTPKLKRRASPDSNGSSGSVSDEELFTERPKGGGAPTEWIETESSSEEAFGEASGDASGKVSGDASGEVSGDASSEVSEDASSEVSGDASSEASIDFGGSTKEKPHNYCSFGDYPDEDLYY